MSAPIGEGIDPVKMATYAVDWEKQTSLKESLWLPGVGDHGGGPTRDMLEVAQRWEQSPFFPTLKFTTAEEYLSLIGSKLSVTKEEELRTIPTWEDELYLEFHRGCYTTHADQKLYNRRCEGLLYEAELFASLATISAGVIYPHAELEEAWKKVLFNQFHDILPGSSIPQVYVDANQAWQDVDKIGNEILDKSLEAIASQISLPPPPHPDALPIIVFNSLNWKRSEVVAVSITSFLKEVSDKNFVIYDLEGQILPFQIQDEKLFFLASNIPSVGYRVFWLCKDKSNISHNSELLIENSELILENELLRVIVDSQTGDLSSVFDKTNDREILSSRGNQLQAFQDKGQYWDAWNIDPNYSQHQLPPAQLKSINWLERGEVRSRLRVVRQIGQSEFCQDYILEVGSQLLKIATTVNWQERGVLVKAAFPLNLTADFATYEIPCGAIERTTHPTTPAEQAKWEVAALRWADLSNGISSENSQKSTTNSLIQNLKSKTQNAYGVSLLNDCKYGYDAQPNQLRLTLLRSASWPDPEADRGYHEFTYALYPHDGNWQSAHTVRRGYELNLPLQAMLYSSSDTIVSACHSERNEDERRISHLPPVASLLDLQAENLIVMAFKRSEDNQQEWILRCYECCGEEAELLLQSDLGLAIAHSINLLEQPVDTPKPSPDEQTFKIAPWKIVSFTAIAQSGKSTE
jgi:alpha-mannosidase